MNKFLNRSVKNQYVRQMFLVCKDATRSIWIFWMSLVSIGHHWMRPGGKCAEASCMLTRINGGDYIKDPETDLMIREADLIKKNGKVPLKNNMISPILKKY